MKYKHILLELDEDQIYTPATIAMFAFEHGMVEFSDEEEARLIYQRIRIAMGRLSNNHRFPDEGDGFVTLQGQPPVPGWFGWRWMGAVHTVKGEPW
ncbi:hypothetical protein [Acanthopleuribacter pedis]|uniref:Uncharacterized protein n=1 Tax=Acanthopleuribacter pedis TaxID=442870 RepID=A0A8J7U672_9BACT|nr:hypothetical protein [Acanthopleuribacter pedis]MBO1322487.1 hypothetical protein [Acanthopleuribacter pedis]